MNKQSCSSGTAFDPEMNCIRKDDVFFKTGNYCEKTPWHRCNTTTERLAELRALCTNTEIVSTTTTTTTEQSTVEGSKTNAGMVIGLIVAGIAIAVFAILLLLFVRRWRQRKQKEEAKHKRTKTVMNVEYFENGNADDPYHTIPADTIPDTLDDPSYNSGPFGNPSTLQSNRTLTSDVTSSSSGISPSVHESVEYDNSAFKLNSNDLGMDQDGYTSTLRRSSREYDRPSNMQRAINEAVNEAGPSNMHRPNVEYVTQTSDFDTSNTKGDAPDYYVLEK
ncbi:uncharacterized protein LOC127881674 isoform X2 [Dreissena polymorpha]|uniref:Uncharacterized protein n=1 Tax=Dreissena polymorpha TaxID=45954 RepID=A0A9D4GTJ3_DREPO|nr:uncharacterized protein LOC127881674 isoform X2 [Dreissena polymorpha]XP_052285738.1 uncharacterized protein LOC127881674 isoform X2 [Dreissena polymorpha]XP_052285739.1 uncharacterized protein LOC127881674 isoform X2 [Dreissena polymorpha]KAH3819692.1 hypothetical protein DPMN_121435 [Dreissena polymorpha]